MVDTAEQIGKKLLLAESRMQKARKVIRDLENQLANARRTLELSSWQVAYWKNQRYLQFVNSRGGITKRRRTSTSVERPEKLYTAEEVRTKLQKYLKNRNQVRPNRTTPKPILRKYGTVVASNKAVHF